MGQTCTPSCPPAARPLRRRRWLTALGCLTLLAAIPVCLYFYLTWARQRELAAQIAEIERVDPRWRLDDVLADRPAIPDDENPAIVAGKVIALLGPAGFDLGPKWDRLFLEPDSVHQLNSPQLDAVRSALAKQPGALKLARTLKDFQREGRFNIPIAPDFISTLIGPLQHCRGIMWLLQCDAMLRAHEEDGDGAMESCRGILVTARAVGDEPFLIVAMIRYAGHGATVATLERVLAQTQPSAPQLEAMQQLLAREIEVPILYNAMRGERAGADRLLELVEQGQFNMSDVASGTTGAARGLERWLLDLAPTVGHHGRVELLQLMTESVEAAGLPPEQQAQACDRIEATTRQRSSLLAVHMLMPAVIRMSQAERRRQANMRCAMAALAVERYRIKHGHWPDTLAAVCQDGLLAAIPTDPDDGQPVRFRVVADGVIIYSVGLDAVDNGGNINRERPYEAGVDQGFRLWHPDARRQDPLPPPPFDD
jgi:hypothetical protein